MNDPVMSAAQRDALMRAALLAPTADNRPVCYLAWVGNCLEISDRGDFTHGATHRQVLAWMALGTMLTNLSVRANHLGLQTEIEWLQPVQRNDSVVKVAFRTAASKPDDGLDGALSLRCSNRRMDFRGLPLDSAHRSQLESDVAAIHNTTLHWLDEGVSRKKALTLIRRAETERFRVRSLHRELFESIRFDVGWSTATTTGIPPGALGLPWIERLGFPAFRHWPVQRIANLLQAHRVLGWRAADLPCRLSPHLCVITAAGTTSRAAINAGRALQAAWLRATQLGLAFQVFAASPLYAMDEMQVVPRDVQANLRAGWLALCGPDTAFVAFRMGHAPAPTVRAGDDRTRGNEGK